MLRTLVHQAQFCHLQPQPAFYTGKDVPPVPEDPMEGGCCAGAPLGTRTLCQAPWEFPLPQEKKPLCNKLSSLSKGKGHQETLLEPKHRCVPFLARCLKLISQQCTHNLASQLSQLPSTCPHHCNITIKAQIVQWPTKHHFEGTDQC